MSAEPRTLRQVRERLATAPTDPVDNPVGNQGETPDGM